MMLCKRWHKRWHTSGETQLGICKKVFFSAFTLVLQTAAIHSAIGPSFLEIARETRCVSPSAPPNHPVMHIFCDANNDDSICGYYLELQKPAGGQPLGMARQVTRDMSRFREFCQGADNGTR